MKEIISALADEHAELDQMVGGLNHAGWITPTPAEPWTVSDQICHLAFFDEKAALSVSDPTAFARDLNLTLARGVEAFLDGHLERGAALSKPELAEWWRQAHRDMLVAFSRCDPDREVPWYGPSMKARSSAAARLMEAWAHGTDIADGLGISRPPTARLFHVAALGVKTFSWSFINRGLEVPAPRVRVELRGPDGEVRVWNEAEADRIYGPVEDFCRVVTQRAHIDRTRLTVEGAIARRWMEIAQVFAGPPGPGRSPEA